MNTEQQHKEMNPLVRTVTAELTNDGWTNDYFNAISVHAHSLFLSGHDHLEKLMNSSIQKSLMNSVNKYGRKLIQQHVLLMKDAIYWSDL